jgi:hypothetical protein
MADPSRKMEAYIGLIKFSHKGAINSGLDSVLPLHAALSGGNDLVMKLLIEQEVEANALR